MDSERLKLIVKNMELLVQSLKKEIEDVPISVVSYEDLVPYIEDDVDEYYTEDE